MTRSSTIRKRWSGTSSWAPAGRVPGAPITDQSAFSVQHPGNDQLLCDRSGIRRDIGHGGGDGFHASILHPDEPGGDHHCQRAQSCTALHDDFEASHRARFRDRGGDAARAPVGEDGQALLAPIVENIFQHAFPEGIEVWHYIRIDTRIEQDNLLVIVEDNGAGIADHKLLKLRKRLEENRLVDDDDGMHVRRKGGIGIVNVHRRIQMVYGEEYGITVYSSPDQGTKSS